MNLQGALRSSHNANRNAQTVVEAKSKNPEHLPPASPPQPPQRPTNVLHTIAGGIGQVVGAPMIAVDALNTGFAKATNVIANALPAFPAAHMGSLAIGAPHAHIAHPPSGPPPVPPTPLPPVGNIMFGCSVQVLINGMPAARCGDLGLNPTCCGLPPIFEVFTGSSNVFIGGARAARMTDITFHCKPVPSGGEAVRGAAKALKTAMQATMLAGMASQALMIVGDTIEAVEADNSAMSGALALNAGMMAGQMAADGVAMAMSAAMGKDPCVPPGSPGAVMLGSPNVHIGGFPMPPWLAVAKGLLKMVKGLRRRHQQGRRNGQAAGKAGCPSCPPR